MLKIILTTRLYNKDRNIRMHTVSEKWKVRMKNCMFQIYKNLSRRMVSEHRETRVPGEPRDFIDCYLDELEKVCEREKESNK